MPKKFYLIIFLIIIIFGIFIDRVIDIAYKKHDLYLDKYMAINNIYITGNSAPRGRILDINGKVIVDNIGVNTIVYHKKNGITLKEEIEIAKSLSKMTEYQYGYKEDKLKDYYLLLFDTSNLITKEELELVNKRELSKEDIIELKKERITDEDLNKMSEEEKCSSYFYYLMNEGYMYDNKILIKNVDDSMYAKIIEANLPGVFGELSWERIYPYNESLRSVLGMISSSLPKEKNYLLDEGYSLNDKVGIRRIFKRRKSSL